MECVIVITVILFYSISLSGEWENELILNGKPSVPFLILISLYTPTHLRVMKRDIFNIKTSSVELVFLYTIFQ